MNVHEQVLERYSGGAEQREAELCCPVEYDASLLRILPDEIIEKDYGCGDPSRYVREGDTVLDLGSGGGKICYMAAQLVGDEGKVIGVDMNDDMLALANKYKSEMATTIGGDRVSFKKGYIQDLALDVMAMDEWLAINPVTNSQGHQQLQAWQQRQRRESPLIADNSVDLVVSNCVLNLVHDEQKQQLIKEVFRVLRPGGRVAISDIVSDEMVPAHLKADGDLWSGCISGAFHEKQFLDIFVEAGFVAVAYDKWDAKPWKVIEDIEFRSVTLVAVKPSAEACLDAGQAVIYKGPFSSVSDDEGHVFPRGERMAVCDRTFQLLLNGPYKDDFIGISPAPGHESKPWSLAAGSKRAPADTRGGISDASCCSEGGCC